MPKTVAPYGTWRSPVRAEWVAGGTGGVRLVDVALDGGALYWIEMRPLEAARYVVMRHGPDGEISEITPAEFSARSRVHEYGGGALAVACGAVYFVNYIDQQIYAQEPGAAPRRLTAAEHQRYADIVIDGPRGRLIAVAEDHGGSGEPENRIVAVALDGSGAEQVLAAGDDFYAAPRLSPDGGALAYQSWRHPNMPWDGCRLWLAALGEDGSTGRARAVAGGERESIFQPAWSPAGALHFVSDRTGWWNLYRLGAGGEVEALAPMAAEFGRAQWIFGMATYGFLADGTLVCAHVASGRWRLGRLGAAGGAPEPLGEAWSEIDSLRLDGTQIAAILGRPDGPSAECTIDPTSGAATVIRESVTLDFDPRALSRPRPISYPTGDGARAHAFYYPPASAELEGPAGERPPLIVKSHGGPTAATSDGLSLAIQFWTSRGFAVLDVNYGGSTGYGRPYRERLDGRWGVVDLGDCVAGARYCTQAGLADGARLAITGGSAGGYTTLCALTFSDLFKAGASHYGIGDLEALARDTHKFESRYLDGLIGPNPERLDLYHARSPIHHTDRLSCPVIFFQGLEDEVVPPEQAEAMVAALKAKGVPVAYVPFEGEQHGFRRAENVQRALEAELWFYGRVFGFEIADQVEPVPMENA